VSEETLGTVEYLNDDEMTACLRSGEQAGWWSWDDQGDIAVAAVYRISGTYYALPATVLPTGVRRTRRDVLPTVIESNGSPRAVGVALRELLKHHAPPLSGPAPRKIPILRQAKLPSWLQLIKSSQTVILERRGEHFVISPWMRDRSRLDGVLMGTPDGYAHLFRPTDRQFGTAVARGCDAAAAADA
jgi:hypothetical protein